MSDVTFYAKTLEKIHIMFYPYLKILFIVKRLITSFDMCFFWDAIFEAQVKTTKMPRKIHSITRLELKDGTSEKLPM